LKEQFGDTEGSTLVNSNVEKHSKIQQETKDLVAISHFGTSSPNELKISQNMDNYTADPGLKSEEKRPRIKKDNSGILKEEEDMKFKKKNLKSADLSQKFRKDIKRNSLEEHFNLEHSLEEEENTSLLRKNKNIVNFVDKVDNEFIDELGLPECKREPQEEINDEHREWNNFPRPGSSRNGTIRSGFSIDFENELVGGNTEGPVPRGLPSFRGSKGIADPQEFLDVFTRICRANGTKPSRYPVLLALCLDSIDARWLESWLGRNWTPQLKWKDVVTIFITHFQNPNTSAQWMSQIRALRMDKDGVQRYSDQYLRLAERLHWNLADETTIYQYKSGLSNWMLDQLSVAESNHLLAMETQIGAEIRPITVEILAKLAIRIEANKMMQSSQGSQYLERNKEKAFQYFKERTGDVTKFKGICNYCKNIGHKESECRIKQKNEGKKSFIPSKGIIGTSKPTIGKTQKDLKEIQCYKCNEFGHYASNCTSRIKIAPTARRARIQIETYNEKNQPEESFENEEHFHSRVQNQELINGQTQVNDVFLEKQYGYLDSTRKTESNQIEKNLFYQENTRIPEEVLLGKDNSQLIHERTHEPSTRKMILEPIDVVGLQQLSTKLSDPKTNTTCVRTPCYLEGVKILRFVDGGLQIHLLLVLGQKSMVTLLNQSKE